MFGCLEVKIAIIEQEKRNGKQQIFIYYRFDLRLETLAVSSPLPANVDEDHMGIIYNMFLPVGRRERNYVGGEQILASGRGCYEGMFISTKNGEEGNRRCCKPAEVSAADDIVTKDTSHSSLWPLL